MKEYFAYVKYVMKSVVLLKKSLGMLTNCDLSMPTQ